MALFKKCIYDITFGISIGKKTVPWHFAAHWQRQKIVPGLDVDDAVEILLRWRPQDALKDNYESVLHSSRQRRGPNVRCFIRSACFPCIAFF